MATKLSFRAAFAAERESLIQEIREEKRQQAEGTPEGALVWSALTPAWTIELAEACDFPAGGSVSETFQGMVEANLCESSATRPALDEQDDSRREQPELSFSMRDATRTEVLERIFQDPQRGQKFLQSELVKIGTRILLAQIGPRHVSIALKQWAMLASRATFPEAMAGLFSERIQDALERKSPGELLRWIEAARPLELLLKGALTTAIERATRQLELFHRRNEDDRYVRRNFIKRPPQLNAFERLMDPTNDAWALHYVGPGGIGKTMLIRYLTAQVLPEAKGSFARLDFDYLNPNYPARTPGLLLSQLAVELQNHDQTGAATELFSSFREKIERLHETLGASPSGSPRTIEQIMSPVIEALPLFVDALRNLPQPVVIILDTCEELAKIRPETELENQSGATSVNAMPRALSVTFELFERLHANYNALRVIFSGRRPLASSGAGWRFRSSSFPPRAYLRAHPIRGFTSSEADLYLTRYRSEHPDDARRVPAELIEPIKRLCLIKSQEEQFIWDDPNERPPTPQLCHPFELALYAAWSCDDPTLTAEKLAGASVDRYMEVRIVGRIEDPILRDMLPAVALLGRFGADVLRAVTNVKDQAFQRVFQELSEQEWILRRSSQILEVEEGLQQRLRNYFTQVRPAELELARQHAAAHLVQLTQTEALDKLDISYFGTTLRLLRPEPKRALQWWQEIEARFAREQAFDWAKRVCESLLGEESQASETSTTPTDSFLRGAVRATYAASLLHTDTFDKLEETWASVDTYASSHQPLEETRDLARRAIAGRLAAARYAHQQPAPNLLRSFWQMLGGCDGGNLSEQLAGSFIAGIEAVLESCELAGQPLEPSQALVGLKLASGLASNGCLSPVLRSSAATIAARICVLQRTPDESLQWFHLALESQIPTGDKSVKVTPQTWLDWLAPDEPHARAALEFVRGVYPAVRNHEETLELIGDKLIPLESPDSDRLNSAKLKLIGAQISPIKTVLEVFPELTGQLLYGVRHKPLCRAHESYAPFFAAAAEEVAAVGEVDRALSFLQNRASSLEVAATAFDDVLEADRVALRIIRRMRLRDEEIGGSTSIDQSLLLEDKALFWAVDGLCNPPSSRGVTFDSERLKLMPGDRNFAWFHERFRTLCARPKHSVTALIDWAVKWLPSEPPAEGASFAEMSCAFDCVEVNEICNRQNLPQPFPHVQLLSTKDIKRWLEDSRQPVEALTLLLRWNTLTHSTPLREEFEFLAERIGRRRAAQLALEEGELLALRLPEHAVTLLDQACGLFKLTNDFCSATIASACSAVAHGFLDSFQNLRQTLDNVRNNYAYRLGIGESPPSWQQLEELAENPSRELLDKLTPRGWRPWLVRIVACLTCIKDHDSPKAGARSELLRQWLEANYAAMIDGATRLPPELDLASWTLARGPEDVPTRGAKKQPNYLEPHLTIRLSPPQYEWRPLQASTPTAPPFHASVQMEWRDSSTATVWQSELPYLIPGLAPYREATRRLPKEFPALLHHLMSADQQQGRNGVGGIELRLDQYASWVCWEAIFYSALEELAPDGLRWFNLYRTLSKARVRRVPPLRENLHVLSVINDISFRESAHRAWSGESRISHEIIDSERMRWAKPPHVLHLIGAPVETSAGIRLDVAAERRLRKAGLSSRGSRGELLRPDEITHLFGQLRVCVLQATPNDYRAERTQSDREQAAYLRQLGAELFSLGIPAVLVVPPLGVKFGEMVLTRLTNPFRQNAPLELSGMPNVLGSARAMIQTRNADPTEADFETAFDLCLYAHSQEMLDEA